MSETYIKFGAVLKLERERRGIKLDAVSGDLKIPVDTLLHVESGDVAALPAELYFRLFAKSYAEFLGIDFTKTIEAIREELGESLEPTAPDNAGGNGPREKTEAAPPVSVLAPKPRRLRKTGILVTIAVVLVAAVCVVAYFWFLENQYADENAVDTVPSTFQDFGSMPEYDRGWDTIGYTPGDTMVLVLTARVGSWATVLADGDTMLYQMLTPDRPYIVAAREQLLVTIGNPLVVDVTLDGRAAQLADPETGEVSQVEIDLRTREIFLVPVDSTASASPQ